MSSIINSGGGTGVLGPVINVKDFGAVGDAQMIKNGVTSGGGHTVTSVSNPFKASDVGKKIYCIATGNATPLMPISTITAFNSASSVTTNGTDNGAASSLSCAWYTKDDTAAFQAANAAANANAASNDINFGPMLMPFTQAVYVPTGGYVVSGRIFKATGSGSSSLASFIGAGRESSNIYLAPGIVDPNDGFAWLMSWYNGSGAVIRDFSIQGMGLPNPSGGNHAAVELQSVQSFFQENVGIFSLCAGGGTGAMSFKNAANGVVNNLFVQGTGNGCTDFAVDTTGASSITINNPAFSNHNQNLLVQSNGRGDATAPFGVNGITLVGGFVDECGSATLDCAIVQSNGLLIAKGTVFMVGNTGRSAINIDATSNAIFDAVNCTHYASSTVLTHCATIANGGSLYATNSLLMSNGASTSVISGGATANFIDVGGNTFKNCVSGTCTQVTAATYGTLGFSGGIIPKATVTHTPNTCYAVGGTLVASQNLCTIRLDQNYQVLNVTAQSGGASPSNSSCVTPPVITMSDGTRTATLTMTSGQTTWSSAVDAQTNIPGQVFAAGATLTISIGTFTCVTPPANVSVNFALQSVLNS